MLKLVHLSRTGPDPKIFTPVFVEALRELGELTMVNNGDELSAAEKAAILRQADVALTGWSSSPLPESLATDPGRLKYVCNVTGEISEWVPLAIIEAGLPFSNWGDAPAFSMAEGAVALLLAALKDLHEQIMEIRDDRWHLDPEQFGGTLLGANLGVYGCGVIGRKFVELRNGRLRAGLDVLDPDGLPAGHEARQWKNCILTAHHIHRQWPTHGQPELKLQPSHDVCLDNLQRFARNKPLRFLMDAARFTRSTRGHGG